MPFRNAFYEHRWGLCVAHSTVLGLTDDWYDVHIDTTLENGHLTYAEYLIEGELEDEFVFTTYMCHPQLASELTGVVLLWELANLLKDRTDLKYSYRFVWWPATIGPITWLDRNRSRLDLFRGGLMAMTVGDAGTSTTSRAAGDGRKSTVPSASSCGILLPTAMSSSPSCRGAETSDSCARLASTCRSVPSRGRRAAPTPSTTVQPMP